jgi:hypothetical protein
VLRSAAIQNFTTLCVAPLFEQIRRFSSMFVGPFIEQSPIKRLLVGPQTVNSVLYRSFLNQSKVVFSFACLDADRVRGISADCMMIDEVQDMNREHIPIIDECLSASKLALRQFTGTPKTLDNTIEKLWERSTQSEWFIPCFRCTTNGFPTWNIPSKDFHIEKMIGPYHDEISEKCPGVICHNCGKPINPRLGRWVHKNKSQIGWFHGYHIPQIIMPMHYASPVKWAELLGKMHGKGGTSANMFWNEVLGESYDVAAKIITQTDLDAVSNLGPNTQEAAMKRLNNYRMRVLAVDWGGGGEKGSSYTVVALVGMLADGSIEVPFARRLLTPHDHLREAAEVKHYWRAFRPHMLAHDYTGAGALRETVLVQEGVPVYHIFPAMYIGAARGGPCFHVAATEQHPREHYRVDKSRTLLYTCAMIRGKKLHFFNKDYENEEDPGLIHDFLALYEEKIQTAAAGEIFRIDSQDGMTDDFAQAVNIGCVALWYRTHAWPNIAALAKYALDDPKKQAAEGDDEKV